MSASKMEAAALYEVKLLNKQVLKLRRMSEREKETFMKSDFPWLYEHSQKLLRELDKHTYRKYCEVLAEALLPLVADRDPKSQKSETAEIILAFADDARQYRFDAFNLLEVVLQQEGLSGRSRKLPTAEEVDNMTDDEVASLGEGSPPSSQAESTTQSGSPAATPSDGSTSSTATKPKRSGTSRNRSSRAGSS